MKITAIISVIALTLTAGVSAKVDPGVTGGNWDNFPKSPNDPIIWDGPLRDCAGPYAPPNGKCGQATWKEK